VDFVAALALQQQIKIMAATAVVQAEGVVLRTLPTQVEAGPLLLSGEVTNISVAEVAELAPHLATLVGDAVVLSAVAEQVAVVVQVCTTQLTMVHP
jgi:hypothetical protein